MEKEGLRAEYSRPSTVFKVFIEQLFEKYKRKVVVLIDEYDQPILGHIPVMKLADVNRGP
jgi:hypothetical protein